MNKNYLKGFIDRSHEAGIDPVMLAKTAGAGKGIINSVLRGNGVMDAVKRTAEAFNVHRLRKAVDASGRTRSIALNTRPRWMSPGEFGRNLSKASPGDIVSGARINGMVNGSYFAPVGTEEASVKDLIRMGMKRLKLESSIR